MPAHRRSDLPGSTWPLRWLALVIVAALLTACASRTRAPVEDRAAIPPQPGPPPVAPLPAPAAPMPTTSVAPEADWRPSTYTVKRGDTLHQIALDHGLDYRELAALNSLENVNLILVGQVLRLAAPGSAESPVSTTTGVTTAPLRMGPAIAEVKPGTTPAPLAPAAPVRNTDNYKSSPKAVREPYSEQALRDVARVPVPAPENVAVAAPAPPPRAEPKPEPPSRPALGDPDDDKLDWAWPAKGKVVGTFSETANLKGIDIAGAAGTPVSASAAGTVVYAGSGLRGYGKLIIIKHNKTFLSAYAHNRDILVKEGQQVTRGQKIAEMGSTDATETKLHFEIRRLGKPMDPVRYLPPA